LVCDTNSQKDESFIPLKNKINNILNEEKRANNIGSASVYFQDFNTDGRVDINPDEQFAFASLGKVPVMIAVYRMAEFRPRLSFGKG